MRERGFVLGLVCLLALAVGPQALAQTVIVDVPLDQQINFGHTWNSQSPSGDAIYVPTFDTLTTLSFRSDEPEGYVRASFAGDQYFYVYVDFNLADITTPGTGLDFSDPAKLYKLQIDCRYYQDPVTNSDPYGDAPIALRVYTYDADGETYLGYRHYDYFYGTQGWLWGDEHYPVWVHKEIPLNYQELWPFPYEDGGSFDLSNVSRLRFIGTDWAGRGDDFVDLKNLKITEEYKPATISGVVTDTDGKPVPGAVVGFKLAPNATADAVAYAQADGSGRYSLLLEADTYYLAAWRYGNNPGLDSTVVLAGVDTVVDLQVGAKAGANIAQGAAVTATSDDPAQFPAANAVDGSYETRWTTQNPLPETEQDQSYVMDFGSVEDVTGFMIIWENAFPRDYSVDVTTDDPAASPVWTSVYSATNATGGWHPGYGKRFDPIRFEPGTQARAIQVHVTKFGPYPVYSAWEFIAHGTAPSTIAASIADLKSMPDGAPVEVMKPVSASGVWDGGQSAYFADLFWFEELDRSNGMRVHLPGHAAWPLEFDRVTGVMATDPTTGERYIEASAVDYMGAISSPFAPFAMANKSLTAGKLPFGLIVKTWGKVTDAVADGYTIDDGSGIPVKVVTDGLKPSVGAFVTVTGPLSGEPTIYVRPGDGYIRTWLFHGGYSNPSPGGDEYAWQQSNLDQDFLASAGGEVAIQPNPGDTGPNGAQWFVETTSNWDFDLTTLPFAPSGEGMTTVYASVWLLADREYLSADPFTGDPGDSLQFLIGSDDGYKLYLNGEAICERNVWRITTPDEDVITHNEFLIEQMVLNAGWNHLLIKVNNITGSWGFGLRMMVDDPTTGLQVPLELPYAVAP